MLGGNTHTHTEKITIMLGFRKLKIIQGVETRGSTTPWSNIKGRQIFRLHFCLFFFFSEVAVSWRALTEQKQAGLFSSWPRRGRQLKSRKYGVWRCLDRTSSATDSFSLVLDRRRSFPFSYNQTKTSNKH